MDDRERCFDCKWIVRVGMGVFVCLRKSEGIGYCEVCPFDRACERFEAREGRMARGKFRGGSVELVYG